MKTIHYLTDPSLAPLLWPAVIAATAIAALCSVLSVLVVLKRMAFIGQGISHAAFGGIGLAAVLGLTATSTTAAPADGLWQFLVVTGFCLLAAVAVGVMAKRGQTEADTAIGIILVGSMAVGALLLQFSRIGLSWESFLFGSILEVRGRDAAIAWLMTAVVLGSLWWLRRPLLFWAFDEPAAMAFGVRGGPIKLALLLLLALATVTAMKLAGVVLATAMLVLPGAAALRLSERLPVVLAISGAIAMVGVLGGLVLSFEGDLPPGPSMVCVLTLVYILTRIRAGTRSSPRVAQE